MWIHLTAWHSILYAYEKYGPGRLSREEEARYWADCAIAAELQTCDPADVPRDREGVREYFERVRPQLVGSAVARSTMDHLLHAEVMLPPIPPVYWPATLVATTALRVATVASMPRWMREMAGIHQSHLMDTLIVPVMRISFRLSRASRWLQLGALHLLSPSTLPVVAPVLFDIPPATPETLSPAEARERYGYAKPRRGPPRPARPATPARVHRSSGSQRHRPDRVRAHPGHTHEMSALAQLSGRRGDRAMEIRNFGSCGEAERRRMLVCGRTSFRLSVLRSRPARNVSTGLSGL
ncbi:oxygenase MpaB family protein [Amycolatopsis sp. cmx-11-12]|uniref:oxygenase MpaB family protein n=1 Tax=Amycolatopsis sp. cmx-11-12 TaxID=2785795 RepID=UPI003917CFA0